VYAGAIEAYEHAIVFARPFRVRGVAIETQAVAFFTTESVEQFVSVFVRIRVYRVGHFSVQLFFSLFCSFFFVSVLYLCVFNKRRQDWKFEAFFFLFFSSSFLLLRSLFFLKRAAREKERKLCCRKIFDFENTPKTRSFSSGAHACASLLHRDETRTENEHTEHS
jgi:FlaA1/EpsC-like NDP-sugar epimerase